MVVGVVEDGKLLSPRQEMSEARNGADFNSIHGMGQPGFEAPSWVRRSASGGRYCARGESAADDRADVTAPAPRDRLPLSVSSCGGRFLDLVFWILSGEAEVGSAGTQLNKENRADGAPRRVRPLRRLP